MKGKFTKIMAALALLVFMMPSVVVWGQSVHTIGWGAASGEAGTYTNFAATSGTVANVLSFTTAKNSSSTNPAYNASASELRLYYASNGNGGSITIEPSDGITITDVVMTTSTAPSVGYSVDGGDATTISATNNTYTISGISATNSLTIQNVNTTNTQLRISTIALTYTVSGGITYTCDTPTFNPAAGTYTEAQTVTISCATEGATIYYTLDGTDPTTDSEVYSSALTISETTTVKAMAVKADYNNSEVASATYEIVEPVSGYTIDFEQAASLYSDWTFANMESHQTGNSNVSAHGGTYYGTTGGKASASIVTKEIIATPYTLTCYVTKQTTNTTSSTWHIQVSENGTTWTDVATQDATSMDAGTWVEFTANLSSYTNVYVRVYYSGSTAVRNIDDLTLVTTVPTTPLINVTEPDELAYNATSGSIMYEIANYVEGNMVATSEADWISDFTYEQADEIGEVVFTTTENNSLTARTATINLTYTYGDNQTTTASVTVTQAGNPNAPGTENNPYTVAQARAAIDAGEGVNDVYATGIVSEIVTAYSSQYGNISYNISADGSTEADQLQAYRGKSYNGENFTSEDDIQVGDIVVVYGDLKNYNGTYEFDAGNQLVSLERPQSTEPSINIDNATIEVAAEGGEGILTVQYENITDIAAAVYFCDAEGTEATYDWITAEIDTDNNVSWLVESNEGEARTAYFKVWAYDDELSEVYSNLVTVNQEAYVAPITSGTGTITFGKGNDVEINDETVTGIDGLNNTWTITTEGTTSFTNNSGTGYSQVGSSSKPATSITFTVTLPNEAVVSSFEAKFGGFNGTAGNVTLSVGSETVGTGALNASNDVTISSLPMITGTILTVTVTDIAKGVKCYYISYTLGAESYTLNITGYASDDTKDGYYLIASPVIVNPATVAGMTEGDFDLYSYDDTEELEWRNYEASAFNLEPGKGYLYAKKATTENPSYEFTLTGAPYAGQPIQLIQGWNLVGNPYGQIAYITNEYYMMNPEGNDLVPGEGNAIDVMQGIFVNATEAGTMTFSTENNAKAVQQVVMNVTRNRGAAIDRAIVRFDEGQQLPKFQLFQNSTKLFIPQGDNDYAIVRSANQGEMPVNFKARENGTYTLAVETENVEMDYLHLIDNKTGMDVDLLQTPSYTFEATTRDYASRFRLVFSANDNNAEGNAHFAYFNGSEWQISNKGEATLQVVDVMGRIVKNMAIEDNATVSINEMPGVYMMRLLNGNDVKVQKVIIK